MGLGKTYSTKYLLDSNNSSGVAGQVLSTTSTGIDWVDANTVPGTGLWLANGNDIYNSNSGNVGIGITGPTAKLHLFTSGAEAINLGIQNSERYYKIETDGGFLTFNDVSAGGTARMVIDSSGNVGIGVTGPATKLEVSSSLTSGIKVTNSGTINGEAGIEAYHTGAQTGTAYAGYITKTGAGGTNVGIYTAASGATNNYGLIVGSGNVGIGTTSPSRKLHVNAGTDNEAVRIESSDTEVAIELKDTTGTATIRSRGDFRFDGSSGEIMRMESGGNVGIGVTSPNSKLQIGFTGSLGAVTTNKEINVTYDGGYSTSNSLQYQVNAHVGTTFSSADIFTQTSGEVLKNFYVGIVSPNSYFNNNRYSIIQGGAERLTILGSISSGAGNVGIGTISPDAKLDVTDGDAQMIFGSASSARPWLRLQHNIAPADGEEVGLLDFNGFNDANQNTRYAIWIAKAEDVSDGTEDGSLTLQTLKDGTSTTTLIARSGKVAIGGTLSPSQALDVTGKIRLTDDIQLDSTSPRIDFDNGAAGSLRFFSTSQNATKLSITSAGAIQFNAYDSTNNTGTPTYLLGTDASGNIVKTNTGNTPVGSNIYTLPSTTGSSAWKLLGRFTANQGGQSIFIKMVTNAGYNASLDQNAEVYIRFKTSNGSSVDANGFAGDSSFYTIGAYSGYPGGNIKWVSNAAGGAATSYELYINMPSYSGIGGFYSVENTVGTWTPLNNAATDPGAASSTILLPTKQFKVGGSDLVVGAGGADSYFANSNVGIGTTSPQTKLHVEGLTRITEGGNTAFYSGNYVRLFNSQAYQFRNSGGSVIAQINLSGDSYFNGGNVGIGTTSPGGIFEVFQQSTGRTRGDLLVDAGAKYVYVGRLSTTSGDVSSFKVRDRLNRAYFDVNTASKYISFNPEVGDITMQIASGYGFKVNGGQFNVNATSGNVGIGTTSPSEKLTVDAQSVDGVTTTIASFHSNEGESGDTAIQLAVRRSDSLGSDRKTFLNATGAGNFEIQRSGSTKVTISGTGNVGIGTTSPSQKLEVNGIARAEAVNVYGAGDASSTSPQIYSPSTGAFAISGNGSEKMRITSAGNVGIGITNPAVPLDVEGKIRSNDNSSGDYLEIFCDGSVSGDSYIENTNNNIQIKSAFATSFSTSGSVAMFIKNNQNVGIGTITPGAKLDVAGIIFAGDGNKATPGYSFASDPDTGMFRDSTNVLVLGVNGDTRIRISNTDIVTYKPLGVNTTSITSGVALDVGGNVLLGGSGVGDLYLGNYATANHFRFHTNNSNTYFDMNCGDIYWRQGASTRYTFFPTTANMTVNGTITQLSDIRNKENIVEISDCISKVQAMRGVYYNRTDFNTEVTKVGVIAQEVEAVLPELVLESPETGLKSVAYSELTSVLINAIKEQQEIIEDLKTRITKLEN